MNSTNLDADAGALTDDQAIAKLAGDLRLQASGCESTGSALYASLLRSAADDVEARGVCWELLRDHAHLSFATALHLRLMGAVHRLALRGDAPALAGHYPSCGGTPGHGVFDAFLATIHTHRDYVRAGLEQGVQTNEVVRSSALFEAFGFVQRHSGLPLALRELGCSGGLNLALASFRYVDGDRVGGDPEGAVVIADRWRGSVRPSFTALRIVDRAGCDPNPLDPSTDYGRLQLLGFLWPDQVERAARTRAAIDLVKAHPAPIVKSNGDIWVSEQLTNRSAGAVTVIYHSIVWQYIDKAERARIADIIRTAGATATSESPIAWVMFEPAHGPDESHSHAQTTLHYFDGSDIQGSDIQGSDIHGADLHGTDLHGTATVIAKHGYHGEWVELLTS